MFTYSCFAIGVKGLQGLLKEVGYGFCEFVHVSGCTIFYLVSATCDSSAMAIGFVTCLVQGLIYAQTRQP